MDENNLKEKAGFTLRGGELACALLMYPTAYIYTVFFGSKNDRLWFGVFVLLFIGITEILNRARPRPKESWVWLGCVLLMSACVAFGWGRLLLYGGLPPRWPYWFRGPDCFAGWPYSLPI